MKTSGLLWAIACAVIAVLAAVPARASEADSGNIYQQEIDDLLLFYETEDLIYTVSKRKERIMESPSAVHIITAEDIRYSGAQKITDLFRMVPGIDVADVNAFYTGVQGRGFSFFPKYARQMLVLVDGRTVYSPQINATFWDQIPLFLENIQRIEVIRGPNAALYGANAFQGVINIITKEPEETQGGLASVTAGSRDSQWAMLRYGAETERFSCRATAGYRSTEGFSGVHDYVRRPQVTFRCNYHIDDSSRIIVDGGYAGGDREIRREFDPEINSYFLIARFEKRFSSRTRMRLHYYHDYRNSALTFGHEDKLREDDVELQINHDGDRYNLVFGTGYRIDRVRHGFLSREDYREFAQKGPHGLNSETSYNHIFKTFVNYTYHLGDLVHLTAALMVEDNDFVGTMYSPKGAVVYTPTENHSLRLSVSRAYRTPSFIEERASMSVPAPFYPFYIGQQGNSSLSPERITAYEAGYRGRYLGGALEVNVEAFYHDIDDTILYRRSPRMPAGRGDSLVGGIYRYDNYENNHVRGVELSVAWDVSPWWHCAAHYTYQRASNDYLEGLVVQQKASVSNRFRLPQGFSAAIHLYYVDRMHFEQEAWIPGSSVDDYLRLDIRIAKSFFSDRLECALIGQNLLDPRHYEYPEVLSAGEATRNLYVELRYRF